LRKGFAPENMPVLPEAPPWLQVRAVSPMTTSTLSTFTFQLVGHDLRNRDVERLAHVHLAEESGDAPVGQNRDPGIEAPRDQRRFATGRLGEGIFHEGGPGRRNDERPGGLSGIRGARCLDAAAARAVLTELQQAQPSRPEAAQVLRELSRVSP